VVAEPAPAAPLSAALGASSSAAASSSSASSSSSVLARVEALDAAAGGCAAAAAAVSGAPVPLPALTTPGAVPAQSRYNRACNFYRKYTLGCNLVLAAAVGAGIYRNEIKDGSKKIIAGLQKQWQRWTCPSQPLATQPTTSVVTPEEVVA
jgi:hypothetical protein